jgi:phosphoenolpyruvate carboxykinase (diphosphate)
MRIGMVRANWRGEWQMMRNGGIFKQQNGLPTGPGNAPFRLPMHTLKDRIGFTNNGPAIASSDEENRLREFVNLKLAARGHSIVGNEADYPFLDLGRSLIANFQEKSRLLADYLCPVDAAIDSFLQDYLGKDLVAEVFPDRCHLLPVGALVAERHGIARILSLPPDQDEFKSSILSSYRVGQGVCHNPASDRRTTEGVFHVADGGLPVPADKKCVPKAVFARLLRHALTPPDDLMVLPFTGTSPSPARVFISLLLRPVICPEVPGVTPEKSMEIRFFAPGNLVSNLDFVESIFGNAGDPFLPENDSRLDARHWSGHSGCVILAPHLVTLTKKELGLPHERDATARQRRDGMCWSDENELYNGGGAFKITCRDKRGVIVTLIADNYYGYCKKEVKTQISYAANLYGNVEEEHAGGAIAFPSFDLGEDFSLSDYNPSVDHRFSGVMKRYSSLFDLRPEGYGVDKRFSDILYVPEDVRIELHNQSVTWTNADGAQKIQLRPGVTYVLPSGYKVEMIKPTEGMRWRLIGTNAEGTFCHKPCTVSGGGKSEISKSISDAMISAALLVWDLNRDLDEVEAIVRRNFEDRYPDPPDPEKPSRPLLSPRRSLGSVIRLLTPSPDFTDAYNSWLGTIGSSVRDLVYLVKRFYKPDWGDQWRDRFSVDLINGELGRQLIYRRQRLIAQYLRVGFTEDGSWRTFSVRKDFAPARKIQTEDDISASVVVPVERIGGLHPAIPNKSIKFIKNCEYRLFQRPDDAIVRGYDKKTESDFSKGGLFFSNYQPIPRSAARVMVGDAIRFEQFTPPMRRMLAEFVDAEKPEFVISSNQPRLVDGKPTKNPRYLQNRPDLEDPRALYLAKLGKRFFRRLPVDAPVPYHVNSVLAGRRNNPPDANAGIRALAVYNPIHYQELPELFMDFIASLTGKSPSTTGAGSEGALTKGPFNALLPVHDLNAAMVSYVLTGYHGFTTAAGHVGRKFRVDHDISLLVPEVWSRMFISEREPEFLIAQGCLEKVDDFTHNGRCIEASRLGYRITARFVSVFFGRVFSAPDTVFTEEMLKPELQSMEDFVDGLDNIIETQRSVALNYFDDGGIESACPPIKALLHIMAHGNYEGRGLTDPEIRRLFTREALLSSDWYRARLESKTIVDRALWSRHVASLEAFLSNPAYRSEILRLGIEDRLAEARTMLAAAESPGYRENLVGMLGTDPALVGADDAGDCRME